MSSDLVQLRIYSDIVEPLTHLVGPLGQAISPSQCF